MTLAQRVFEEKRSLIYPVGIVLVLNVALFVAVVYPLSRKVAAGESSALSANVALANARRDFESANATVSGRAAADAELTKFYGTVLSASQSEARRLMYQEINQLAAKANVTYQRANSEPSQERTSTLGKLTTTIELSGEYRAIRQFIYALETAPGFLILENVAVTQGSDESTVLNVTVKVATYYQAGADGV